MADVYDYYYENYLMLYSLYGRGRPRLNRDKFEELDRELLTLVTELPEKADENGEAPEVARTKFNRIRELEYILLDDVAESLLSRNESKAKENNDDAEEGDKSDARQTASPKFALEFRWSDDSGRLEA